LVGSGKVNCPMGSEAGTLVTPLEYLFGLDMLFTP